MRAEASRDDEPARKTYRRKGWKRRRLEMERGSEIHTPAGRRPLRRWDPLYLAIKAFGFGLRILGLRDRGLRNASEVGISRLELAFDDLPQPFDGFRILQLSDLHVDFHPAAFDQALERAAGITADLCVLTGDYRERMSGGFENIMPAMKRLATRLQPGHGILAILGNHDCADMVEVFESLGINLLVNETHTIENDGAALHLTGTDDVHSYFHEAALAALAQTPAGFKIALVHSAELADFAAGCGFRLYLAGHTHGGQICLPGGRPIVTHMHRLRRYASGLWRHENMTGYTSSGVGVSALPVRFNCRGEVALITLRRRHTQ